MFTIEFMKNGKVFIQNVIATSEMNALVRLGQIYGDGKIHRDDVIIEIIKIEKVS